MIKVNMIKVNMIKGPLIIPALIFLVIGCSQPYDSGITPPQTPTDESPGSGSPGNTDPGSSNGGSVPSVSGVVDNGEVEASRFRFLDRIELTWNPVAEAGETYAVYRYASNSENAQGTEIYTGGSNQHLDVFGKDSPLESEKPYYYKVFLIKKNKEVHQMGSGFIPGIFSANAYDHSEPNDGVGDASSLRLGGETETAFLSSFNGGKTEDDDWYSFTAENEVSITIALPEDSPLAGKTVLEVRGQPSKILVSSWPTTVSILPPKDGTITFRVGFLAAGDKEDLFGSYTVKVASLL